MPIRIAVNGFGRIGRQVLRIALSDPKLEFVAINDIDKPETLAHLFKYDSIHKKFPGTVAIENGDMVIDGKPIKCLLEKDPSKLPWKDLGVDIVLECTGKFTDRAAAAQHLTAGAKKVLISAPAKEHDGTFVFGVNAETYDPAKHHIISIGSCTTNCLAPIAKVLQDTFGIEKGFMTTIHAYTNDQRILDLPHKDLRRARAAAMSMIPTSTGAAKALAEVIPELKGKLHGISVRVPVPDGSLVDLVFQAGREVTVEEVNAAVEAAAEGYARGIIEYNTDPIVSVDVVGNPHSSVFDAPSTMVLQGNLVKILAWYDNEWGFSNRMTDMLRRMM